MLFLDLVQKLNTVMAHTSVEIMWLRWLLQDMGVNVFSPTPINL